MTFSVQFFIFILLSALAFYAIRPKMLRIYLVAAVSLGFCCSFGLENAVTLLITTVVAYVAAFFIDYFKKKDDGKGAKGAKRAKGAWILGIVMCLISLFVFKYAFWIVCKVIKIEAARPVLESIVLPIGLSFYTFGIIDYLTDVYKGKTSFMKNPIYFATYTMYFPKLISGPIEDSATFMDKLTNLKNVRLIEEGKIESIISALLTGYFMKLVIADRALIFVNDIFAHPDYYGSGILILGSLLYTIQIYCDFAGYSLIAIGISNIFGIELMDNFKTPYFAENITDFWRRWHISLSNWLKEYIYIPLGGNRRGIKRQYLNIFIVFLVCGIWHGAAFKFVFWGILHGLYSICARFIEKRATSDRLIGIHLLIRGVSGRIVTFLCVSFAWIFFGSVYLRGALKYIGYMFNHIGCLLGRFDFIGSELSWKCPDRLNWSLFEGYRLFADRYFEFAILTAMVIVLGVFEYISYKRSLTFERLVTLSKRPVRYILWYLLFMAIIVLGVYGTHVSNASFIYMQF